MAIELEANIIPHARDFLVGHITREIGPRLRDTHERLLAAQRSGEESGIVVAQKKQGDHDVASDVTKPDLTIDGHARNAWQGKFPNIPWYSEESKGKGSKRKTPHELRNTDAIVVVDPVDGSGELGRGSPRFSSSFALVMNGRPVLGIIYQAVGDTLWIAERGKPTVKIDRHGERQVHVSKTANLDKAYITTAYAWNLRQRRKNMRLQARLGPFVNQFVSTASSVLDTVEVAQGNPDAMVCLGLYPWDQAAAALAVVKAGGKVTKFTGDEFEWHPFQPEIVASNGLIHGELIKIINRNALVNTFLQTQRILTRGDISRQRKEWVVFRAAKKAQEIVVFLAKKKSTE